MWEKNKKYRYDDDYTLTYDQYVNILNKNNWSCYTELETDQETPSERRARIKAEERERKINIILSN